MDDQLRHDVRFITTRLGSIIREQAEEEVFGHIERLRKLARKVRRGHEAKAVGKPAVAGALQAAIDDKQRLVASLLLDEATQIAHGFTLFFQLVNLCVERARIRRLRKLDEPKQSLRRVFRGWPKPA